MFSFRTTLWRNRLIAICPLISRLNEFRHFHQASRVWRNEGWVVPVPYFVRRAMLLAEARAIGADTFVETGTFLGDTTWSFREKFKRIHTIEVEPRFAAMARKRFAGHPAVVLHEGDSAKLLGDICAATTTPCLFYLDGHYSGGETGKGEKECPAIEELAAIFTRAAGPFRIVIDDARLFGTDPFYPEIARISAFLAEQKQRTEMRVENDAIVISLS